MPKLRYFAPYPNSGSGTLQTFHRESWAINHSLENVTWVGSCGEFLFFSSASTSLMSNSALASIYWTDRTSLPPDETCLHPTSSRPDSTPAPPARWTPLVSACAARAVPRSGWRLDTQCEIRRRLEPICAGADAGRLPPEPQAAAFSADRWRHGYHGARPAVALASGLGDGSSARCYRGSEHVISRAVSRTRDAGVFRISSDGAAFF